MRLYTGLLTSFNDEAEDVAALQAAFTQQKRTPDSFCSS